MTPTGGRLAIRLLAGVEADGPTGERLDLGGKRQRSVLALLALAAPAPVGVDRVIAGVWGEDPPASAPGTLQSYVSRLRRVLGPERIELTAGGYVLRVDPDEIDIMRCRAFVRSARDAVDAGQPDVAAEQLRAALSEWPADPLGDLGDAPFASATGTVLSEERGASMELLYRIELEQGAGWELVGELEAAVADDPYREDLWRHLVVALFRGNRVADSLRAYQRAHDTLAEIGLAPGDALRELGRRVAASDPSVRSADDPAEIVPRLPNPNNVAMRDDAFVGRSAELVELGELVRPGHLVTLIGPGGVGKTRLAEELLRSTNPDMPAGTWLVPLAPVSGRQLVSTIADALGLDHSSAGDVEAIADALGAQQMAIAFDNCEHVLDDVAPLIAALRELVPDIVVVATSRIPLGLADERLVEIGPLGTPGVDADPDEIAVTDAAALFERRAAHHHSGFRITSVNANAIADIVRGLDGLPLAIEMAAALIGLRTPQQIAAAIDERFSLVHHDDVEARHQTLRSMLDWSYEMLTPDQQIVFARLSVFAAGFDAETAAAVCGDGPDDRDRIADHLEALRLRSLVRRTGGTPDRYELLDTMRAYGHDVVAHHGEDRALRRRHLVTMRELTERLALGLTGPDQPSVFARLRQERLEIQQALEQAVVGDDRESLVDIALRLTPWWRIDLAPDNEGLRWTLAAIEHTDDPRASALLLAGAALLVHENDTDHARSLAAEAEAAARQLSDPDDARTRMLVLSICGDVLTRTDDFELAAALLDEAHGWFTQHDDDWGRGYTGLRLFRVMATSAPSLPEAEAAADEFVTALERAGDLHLLAYAHVARASMYRLHGRGAEAVAAVQAARSIGAPLGLVYLDAESLSIEAQTSLALGDADTAATAIADLRRVVNQRAWREGRLAVSALDAELALTVGEYARAHRSMLEIVGADGFSVRPGFLDVASLLVLASSLMGEQPDIPRPDDESLDSLWPWERIEVLYRLAAAAQASERSPVAHVRAALELCREVDAPVWQAAVTQLAAWIAESEPDMRCALARRAADFGRALGARPRAWESNWRSDDGDASVDLDPEAAAAMCSDALELLARHEAHIAGP